jgi:hypothetical protein
MEGLLVNTKIQPQLSHKRLKERIRAIEPTKGKNCTRPSSDPLSSQKILEWEGGWRRQGTYVKSKLQKTASFMVVESLDVPQEHTHTYILSTALILWKSRVDNVFLSFFNHELPKFQSQAGIALT